MCIRDSICIATNGAGVLRKLMVTHTSYLVNHSTVPVMAIPSMYKIKLIKKITYVSDFENLTTELNKVAKLSDLLKCQTEALHYARMGTNHPETIKKSKIFTKPAYSGIKANVLETNIEYSLVDVYKRQAEPELKKDGAIASLSFGAERKFVFKHKVSSEKRGIFLQPGSLLIMKGSTQAHWVHQLPASKKIKELRVNLTFRTIV